MTIMTRATITSRPPGTATVTTTIRAWIREARESRTRRRTSLWRELAQYTTASEVSDLEAAIARCDDAAARDVRRILAAQRFASRMLQVL
jgi:hypothetical protein